MDYITFIASHTCLSATIPSSMVLFLQILLVGLSFFWQWPFWCWRSHTCSKWIRNSRNSGEYLEQSLNKLILSVLAIFFLTNNQFCQEPDPGCCEAFFIFFRSWIWILINRSGIHNISLQQTKKKYILLDIFQSGGKQTFGPLEYPLQVFDVQYQNCGASKCKQVKGDDEKFSVNFWVR